MSIIICGGSSHHNFIKVSSTECLIILVCFEFFGGVDSSCHVQKKVGVH